MNPADQKLAYVQISNIGGQIGHLNKYVRLPGVDSKSKHFKPCMRKKLYYSMLKVSRAPGEPDNSKE